MSKTKRIKALKEFIELEKLNKNPVQEYIDWEAKKRYFDDCSFIKIILQC